jgi:hypothetical protein
VNFEYAVKATKDLNAFIAQRPVKVATCSSARGSDLEEMAGLQWSCDGLADWPAI